MTITERHDRMRSAEQRVIETKLKLDDAGEAFAADPGSAKIEAAFFAATKAHAAAEDAAFIARQEVI